MLLDGYSNFCGRQCCNRALLQRHFDAPDSERALCCILIPALVLPI